MKREKSNIKISLIGLGLLLVLIILLVVLLKVFMFSKDVSTDKKEMIDAGSEDAVKYAMRDIPVDADAGIIKVNELSCKPKEVVDYSIVVVECNTNNKKIKEYYGSSKIYYSYKKVKNEYKYFVSKDREKTIEEVR